MMTLQVVIDATSFSQSTGSVAMIDDIVGDFSVCPGTASFLSTRSSAWNGETMSSHHHGGHDPHYTDPHDAQGVHDGGVQLRSRWVVRWPVAGITLPLSQATRARTETCRPAAWAAPTNSGRWWAATSRTRRRACAGRVSGPGLGSFLLCWASGSNRRGAEVRRRLPVPGRLGRHGVGRGLRPGLCRALPGLQGHGRHQLPGLLRQHRLLQVQHGQGRPGERLQPLEVRQHDVPKGNQEGDTLPKFSLLVSHSVTGDNRLSSTQTTTSRTRTRAAWALTASRPTFPAGVRQILPLKQPASNLEAASCCDTNTIITCLVLDNSFHECFHHVFYVHLESAGTFWCACLWCID